MAKDTGLSDGLKSAAITVADAAESASVADGIGVNTRAEAAERLAHAARALTEAYAIAMSGEAGHGWRPLS